MYIYKWKEERSRISVRVLQLYSSPTTIFPMTSITNNSKIQRIKSFHASTNGIDRKPSKKLNKGNLAQKVSTPYSRGWRRFRKAVQTVFGIFHETHPLSDLFAAFQRRLLIETWCYMRYRLYGHDGPSRSVPYKGTATKRERKKRNPRTGDDGRRLPLGPTVFSFPSSTHRSSQFFSWLAGFKPRDKKRFERQPFTSSIAFFPAFHGRIDFLRARIHQRATALRKTRRYDERTRRAFHALRLQPILFRWNLFIVRTRVFAFALSSNLLSGFHFRFEYVSFGFWPITNFCSGDFCRWR